MGSPSTNASHIMSVSSLFLLCSLSIISSLPVPEDEDTMPPMPYQFTNLVSADNTEIEDDSGVYWKQDETAEESNPGRVDGEYSVWLADGRLMTVTYYVDGDSGFVPTITYTDNYTPEF